MNITLAKNLILTLVVVWILGLATTIILAVYNQRSHSYASAPAADEPTANPIFSLQGFSVTETLGDRTSVTYSAEELKIIPRRFGAFKIKPFYEMELTKLDMKVFLEPGEQAEHFDPFQSILGLDPRSQQLEKAGPLLYRKADGFSLLIHRKTTPWLQVTATEAIFDTRKNQVKLAKAILTHAATGRRIAGHTVTWDKTSQLFVIAGPYVLETPEGSRKGTGITVDSNFNLRNIHKH